MMHTSRMVGVLVVASVAVVAGATCVGAATTTDKVERTATGAAQTAKTGISDSWVTAKTKLDLFADERVKGRQISVETVKGSVTLRGKVDSNEAKAAAASIAQAVDGAKSVRNDLQVVPPGDRPVVDASDTEITRQVEGRLSKDAQLKKVDVRTDGGKVILTGTVPSIGASARASELARDVAGTRAVKNELTYDPANRAISPAPRSSKGAAVHASKVGASGSHAQVMAFQQALKDKGFDPGPIDGTVGPRTTAAVRAYQKAENLTMTGEMNPDTATKLGVKGVRVQAP
jgi:hyperosmotically inducible periplasmic protein